MQLYFYGCAEAAGLADDHDRVVIATCLTANLPIFEHANTAFAWPYENAA